MCNFDDFIGENVYNSGLSTDGFWLWKVATLEVGMTMKVIAGFGNTQQPIDGFESLMCQGFLIMDAEGRGVSDENVEGTPILCPIQV